MTNQNEEETLFPEVKIDKYTIKPWSFGMLFEISPMLDEVISKIEEKNVDIDMSTETVFFSFQTIGKLLSIASEPILKIMKLTLQIEEEEIKSLDMETGLKIAMVIGKQNWSSIKNVFTLLFPNKTEIVGETSEKSEEKSQ